MITTYEQRDKIVTRNPRLIYSEVLDENDEIEEETLFKRGQTYERNVQRAGANTKNKSNQP